jgi:hypothetical protein
MNKKERVIERLRKKYPEGEWKYLAGPMRWVNEHLKLQCYYVDEHVSSTRYQYQSFQHPPRVYGPNVNGEILW